MSRWKTQRCNGVTGYMRVTLTPASGAWVILQQTRMSNGEYSYDLPQERLTQSKESTLTRDGDKLSHCQYASDTDDAERPKMCSPEKKTPNTRKYILPSRSMNRLPCTLENKMRECLTRHVAAAWTTVTSLSEESEAPELKSCLTRHGRVQHAKSILLCLLRSVSYYLLNTARVQNFLCSRVSEQESTSDIRQLVFPRETRDGDAYATCPDDGRNDDRCTVP